MSNLQRVTITCCPAIARDALASAIMRDGCYDSEGYALDQDYIIKRLLIRTLDAGKPLELLVRECPSIEMLCERHGMIFAIYTSLAPAAAKDAPAA